MRQLQMARHAQDRLNNVVVLQPVANDVAADAQELRGLHLIAVAMFECRSNHLLLNSSEERVRQRDRPASAPVADLHRQIRFRQTLLVFLPIAFQSQVP